MAALITYQIINTLWSINLHTFAVTDITVLMYVNVYWTCKFNLNSVYYMQ